ncbi:substrate-binding domain-containing protein [Amycolatopsis sp. K13G38]|uniref:Substrate-binding domain-containing protein n=1 Tax=Amycolatopsis acididurans TaxID=2724524 RepID=A0ABX1J6Z3_9PSEU|nr:substrate-binding domain-containing protein [Amycolatopsis acididurans]NKQ55508.1 substrate-binding domain-containing protein [Amycolatopsis acididurans]
MNRLKLRRLAIVAIGVALPTLLLTACSGGSGGTSSGSSSADKASLGQLFKGDEGTPPTSSPPAAKGKNVWWISCGQVSAACSGYAAAGQAAAQAIGWDFHIADGNLNQANGEATAFRTALAAHPDAIILDAFSCSNLQPELQQAKQQGVPVMGVETTDCSDAGTGPSLFTVPLIYGENYPGQKAWWTGWGTWSGDFVAADSGGQAKIIAAPGQGDPQYDFLYAGFKDALAQKCPKCTIVTEVPWTLADLAPNGPWVTALRNALIKNADADYVWFPFDFNAVESGGAKAVLQSGSKAKVLANSGSGNALDLIRSGQLYAEASAKSSEWESWAAIDELNRHFNGQPSVPEGLGFVSLDKTHNLPSQPGSNYQTTVDYQAMYKKAWGVGQG